MSKEKYAIPAVCAIIERKINGIDYILIQERRKNVDVETNGLLEIPAGKLREYESVFDAIRREVKEETGLIITHITGEAEMMECMSNGYRVGGFQSFYLSQNYNGIYSIINHTFICKAAGEPNVESDEAVDIKWMSIDMLRTLLETKEEVFFAMNVNALKKYLKTKEVLFVSADKDRFY